MVTENKIKPDSWFEEYDKPIERTEDLLPIFEMKLAQGKLARTETVVFQNNGEPTPTKWGATIAFKVIHDGTLKIWFIKIHQYSLLNPIARMVKVKGLVGQSAEVTRTGQGQKETKWGIVFK